MTRKQFIRDRTGEGYVDVAMIRYNKLRKKK